MIVQPSLGDGLCRLSIQLPDPLEDHRLFCVVFPDLLAFPAQLLGHGGYPRVEVRILRLDLFELPFCLVKLLSVRPLRQLPEDVSGSAVIQRLIRSPSDVLQPIVLGMEIRQVRKHPLEGVFWTLPRG